MPSIKWLAGFFDAEGSVSFNYKPCIDIVNTSPRTMFQIKDVLNNIGIPVGINEREKPSKSSKRPRWDLFLRHDNQILPFLKHIGPFIHGKKFQLNLIENWYLNPSNDIKRKIMFANQLNNIVVCKKEVVCQKLGTTNLNEYPDITTLSEEDGVISTYDTFLDSEYIAGLLDGDGSMNMNFRDSKRSSNKRYTPQVLLVNTNKEIIKRYCSVLKNNSIGFFVQFRIAGQTTSRRRWDIIVSGLSRCQKLLNLIKPHLETKKEQGDLLLQYCNYRLLNDKSYNDIGFECKKALEEMRKGIY